MASDVELLARVLEHYCRVRGGEGLSRRILAYRSRVLGVIPGNIHTFHYSLGKSWLPLRSPGIPNLLDVARKVDGIRFWMTSIKETLELEGLLASYSFKELARLLLYKEPEDADYFEFLPSIEVDIRGEILRHKDFICWMDKEKTIYCTDRWIFRVEEGKFFVWMDLYFFGIKNSLRPLISFFRPERSSFPLIPSIEVKKAIDVFLKTH